MHEEKKQNLRTKTEGLLNFLDYKKKRFKFIYVAMFLILFAISLICLLPIIWVALSGFKSVDEMYAVPPTFFPTEFNFSRIAEIWSMLDIGKYFFNSVMLIVGCLACDIVINGLCGYVLSRIKPSGSKIIETLIFWSMLLPGISMVPLYMTFVDMPIFHFNMIGTYTPIWIMAGASAFNVLLFRNFFNGIPMTYIEAAKIDGCSNLGIFARIIIPLSKPILIVVAIFSITGTWGSFMWPYLILGNSMYEPVSVMLYKLSGGAGGVMPNDYMLVMMISVMPMIVVYAIFQKHIVGGMNMSGIKG